MGTDEAAIQKQETETMTNTIEITDVAELSNSQLNGAFIDSDDLERARRVLADLVGQPHEVLYEDASPSLFEGQEDLTIEEIELFEAYREANKQRALSDEQKVWETLRMRRQMWMSAFIEEVETIWLKVDRYEAKLDQALLLNPMVSDQDWGKALNIKARLTNEACRYYQAKDGEWKPDYRGIQGVTRATLASERTMKCWNKFQQYRKACQDFWASDDGRTLDFLNKQRKDRWVAICKAGLQDKWPQYWAMLNSELNIFLTWGNVDEVDRPTAKDEDRKGDIPKALWYALTGMPTEDWYDVLQYDKPSNLPTPTDDELIEAELMADKAEMQDWAEYCDWLDGELSN